MIVEMDSNIMKYKEYCFYSIHRITVPINEILTKEDNKRSSWRYSRAPLL